MPGVTRRSSHAVALGAEPSAAVTAKGPGPDTGAGRQHPVGGRPRHRQAGRLLERQLVGQVHDVAVGDAHVLGERAGVHLGQDLPARIERLITAPGRRQLAAEAELWERTVAIVTRLLEDSQ